MEKIEWYIGLVLGLLIVLTLTMLIGTAEAQTVKIENICKGSKGWECYNVSQGALPEERLKVLAKAKKGLKVSKRTVVHLTDPRISKDKETYYYGSYYRGNHVYSAVMGGCEEKSVAWTRDALIHSLMNEHSNFGKSNFYNRSFFDE